jgi:endoglucanase
LRVSWRPVDTSQYSNLGTDAAGPISKQWPHRYGTVQKLDRALPANDFMRWKSRSEYLARMKKLALLAALTFAACSNNSAGTKIGQTPVDNGDGRTGGRSGSSTGGRSGSSTGGTSGGASGGTTGAGGSTSSNGSGGATGVAPSTGGDAAGSDDTGAGTGSGGVSGSGGAGAPPAATGYGFGARPQQYPMGSIKPTGTQAELDAVVKAAYDKWKAAYVMTACGGHVVKTPSGVTNSSALANGMVVVAMMAGHDPQAQTVFDGMFAVARKFPSPLSESVPPKHGIAPRPGNEYLLSHVVLANCTKPNSEEGSATPSGDLPFALALTLADKQWGSAGKINYLEEAKKTANAIKLYDMNPQKVTGLGDWASLPGEGMWTTVARPNYFMVGYFRAYAKASGDMYWMQAIEAVHNKIADVQTRLSPMTGLFPQYLVGGMNPPGGSFLGDNNAPHYTGGAGLIPLWLAHDYIASGDMRAKAALTKITNWIKTATGGDASKIVDGYRLNGAAVGNAATMSFVAPFGAIAIFDAGNQAWLDSIWKLMSTAPAAGQAADTANLLGMLVVTGNWWQP